MSEYIRTIRQLVGHRKIFTPSTACVIRNSSGELLLQHRSDTRNWGCPGGLLDFGETVAECVIREVAEETGLVLASVDLFGIYSGSKLEGKYPNGDEIASVLIVFDAACAEETIRRDTESMKLKFFQMSALPSDINDHHRPYLMDYCAWRDGKLDRPVVK